MRSLVVTLLRALCSRMRGRRQRLCA